MAYDAKLAERIREYFLKLSKLNVEEKKMFRGLTFMVNGKMCISVSEENMMCRFGSGLQEEVAPKKGFQAMIMKGKAYKGYGCINPIGFESEKDFAYWVNLCLDYNERAKASKKSNKYTLFNRTVLY